MMRYETLVPNAISATIGTSFVTVAPVFTKAAQLMCLCECSRQTFPRKFLTLPINSDSARSDVATSQPHGTQYRDCQ